MWGKYLPYSKVGAPEIEAYMFFWDQEEEEGDDTRVEVKVTSVDHMVLTLFNDKNCQFRR
jgi:hypothetical protein